MPRRFNFNDFEYYRPAQHVYQFRQSEQKMLKNLLKTKTFHSFSIDKFPTKINEFLKSVTIHNSKSHLLSTAVNNCEPLRGRELYQM